MHLTLGLRLPASLSLFSYNQTVSILLTQLTQGSCLCVIASSMYTRELNAHCPKHSQTLQIDFCAATPQRQRTLLPGPITTFTSTNLHLTIIHVFIDETAIISHLAKKPTQRPGYSGAARWGRKIHREHRRMWTSTDERWEETSSEEGPNETR
jgi:hypothetical protein